MFKKTSKGQIVSKLEIKDGEIVKESSINKKSSEKAGGLSLRPFKKKKKEN
jgi:hypothetical protein